jgi:hypothetical protein
VLGEDLRNAHFAALRLKREDCCGFVERPTWRLVPRRFSGVSRW